MRRLRPVAITGMGCLCAAGLDLPTCADFLFQGKRNPAPPSRLAVASSPPYPVFEVPDPFFDPTLLNHACRLRNSQLALMAVSEAIRDAGLDRRMLGAKRVGICIGSSVDESIGNRALRESVSQAEIPVMTPDHRFLLSNPAVHIAQEF
jgi:3-oxoacyl-(acyl-carrier-protein) synthase